MVDTGTISLINELSNLCLLVDLYELCNSHLIVVQYMPLTNQVRGPHCKLQTEFFFPFGLWPKHEVHMP